ncbi:glycosyltransferase family 2 protein [Actinomycetospora cinnamomea]|uniref:glycosyltransferase family 2 protein n=1 Tax=Actinomycetospora cinnamomea TaxID=663609 RepID=UPI001057F237|nr:glycosyltransferase family A protein [Actinomycetospora cinnamomea]
MPSVEVETSSDRPSFSFLVPAYRTEEFIEETIDSVLAQTIPDWELVVVDNGNSDRMADIVRPYTERDPRVRLVRQENRGYAGGVNAAAAASRGRFLVPLCSDDLVAPEYCERMLDAFERQPHADAISPDAQIFRDEDGHVMSETFVEHSGVARRSVPRGDLRLSDIMRQQFLYYGAAFRREAWAALGGHNAGSRLVEDLDLWLRLVSDGYAVRAIPDVLGRFRLRAESLSHAPESVDAFDTEAEEAFTRAAQHSGRPEDLAALDVALRRLRYEAALRRMRWSIQVGDREAARRHARAALSHQRRARVAVALALLTVAPGLARGVRSARGEVRALAERIVDRRRARRQAPTS